MRIKFSIYQKMIFFTLGMVWLTVTIIGLTLLHQSTVKQRAAILSTNEVFAKTLATQGNVLLSRAIQALEGNAANLGLLGHNRAKQIELLRYMLTSNSFFDSVYLANEQAELIYQSAHAGSGEFTKDGTDELTSLFLHRNKCFSNAFWNDGKELVVAASVPIYSEHGKITGYLAGMINLHKNDLLRSLFREFKLSEGGYGYVVDENGRLLYHPESERLYQDVSFNPFVKQVKNGKSGSGEILNINGVPMLAAYHPMTGSGWGVVVQVPRAQLEKNIDAERKLIYLFLTVVSILTIPLTIFYAQHLMQPIRRLIREVQRVSNGDFSVRVPVTSSDEIGWLTRHFNYMVSRLEEMYTRERKKEAEVRQAEKLVVVGQLAAGLAHEIRNPLTPIKGYIQLLLGEKELPQKYQKYLGAVIDEVNGLERIVKEFLLLAKPGFPQRKPSSLVDLINRVAILIEGQAKVSEVAVSLSLPDNLALVQLDQEQISQVLLNLAMNGIQAMPRGGRLVLGIEDNANDDYIDILITDSGDGILPEDLVRLGQPFFSTKETGTGLGLTVSYRIVHSHNGKIEVSSERGQGTTFRVKLPKHKS